MNEQRFDVSVVIPAYGRCPHLSDLIQSLLEQSSPPSEIIVVHSGASDPGPGLSRYGDSVSTWHYDDRKLAGAARNIGLGKCNNQWVAFLDADVRPDQDWLERLKSAVSEDNKSFSVGAVGYASAGGYWGLCLWIIEFGSVHPYLPARSIESGASANLLVPKDATLKVGGFPEGFQPGEDTALQAKLRGAGYSLFFQSDAVVRHFNPPGFRHCLAHLYHLGFWSAHVRKRHKNLRGHHAVSTPALSLALLLTRFTMVSYRLLRWGTGLRRKYIALAPGLMLGSIAWNLGFIRAVVRK